jgi:hypothetical protein
MAAWRDLTRATIEMWVDHRFALGRKPRTVASEVMLVRSFCAFLLEGEEIAQSPLQRPLAIRLPDMLARFIPDDVLVGSQHSGSQRWRTARTMHYARQGDWILRPSTCLWTRASATGSSWSFDWRTRISWPVASVSAMRSSNVTGSST